MTPAARVQAAIDILDLVITAARDDGAPADRIIAEWFRTRRFAGSSDRRAVRTLVYDAIRACGPAPLSGRAAMLRLAERDPSLVSLFDGSHHGPGEISPGEPVAAGGIAPGWLEQALAASGVTGEAAAALLDRAPLDVRVNSLKTNRETIVLPVEVQPTLAPCGLRLPAGTLVDQWAAWRDGLVEVQDTGSQLAALAVGARPGETIVDLCAGAGGKTLALAAEMQDRGRLIAADTHRGRLAQLAPRAERAGVTIAEPLLLDPGREAELLAGLAGASDAVLVDAPCSGTGTWRRNPEARWRLTEARLARYVALQARLLDIGAGLVRPGGRLVYVACSLLDAEGLEQVAAFLSRHPGWRAELPDLPVGEIRGNTMRITPHRDETDGFFIARLSRL